MKYRALHTHNIISEYGIETRIPAEDNKVPIVIIDKEAGSVEFKVKQWFLTTTTNFNKLSEEDEYTIYVQTDSPNVSLQVFGNNLATTLVITTGEGAYWYELSLY